MKNELKREASIHITEGNLRMLLTLFTEDDPAAECFVDDLTEYLMREGKPLALETRTLNITNQAVAKKVFNKVIDDKTDISLLAAMIFFVRSSLKHKGIKKLDNNSSEWVQLKKLVPIVNEYCNDFKLSKREGYIDYLTRGLGKITSYRGYVNKLYDMSESISLEKDADIGISEDPNKELTKRIHDQYVQLITRKTGIVDSFVLKPQRYIKFVEVARKVVELKIKPEDYINAQFEQLEWTGSYPEPEQLINEKAIERYNKNKYIKSKDNPVNLDKASNELTNVLKNIKKNGKKEKD